MKKTLCGLLSISLLAGLAVPTMAEGVTPETITVDPLNYDLSKTTWYTDSNLSNPISVDLTTGKSDWAIPGGVTKYTQENYTNGTVSNHGVLAVNAYGSSPVMQIDVPEVKADGWYDVSYFAGGSETFAWHSSAEFYLTKKSDPTYKNIISQYMPGVNSADKSKRYASVANNDGVWKITGDKTYLKAGADYVLNIKPGKAWSHEQNKYKLLLSEVKLSPTVATAVSTSKATVLEYEDYAGYYGEEKTNASGGKVIREKTAVMTEGTTPYVIEMPVTITKEGNYDWKAVMATTAGGTAASKMTIAIDGKVLGDNTSAGMESGIETWTDEVKFDMDTYSGTTELTVGEHVITTTIDRRFSNSNASMIGFAADFFSLECQDKDVDISKPIKVEGETTIQLENYASLVTYFNNDWGSNAAYDSANGGRLLNVTGGVVPSPNTAAKYEIPINVTTPGYYDTEFWVSSDGNFYNHSLLNFVLDGESIGDANEKAGVPAAKYSYLGRPVYPFKGTTVYLTEGEHKIGIIAEKAVNSGTIKFAADCIKLIPSEPTVVGNEKITFELEKYNSTAVASNSAGTGNKLLYDDWYFANSKDYKINIPISAEEGYYDFETVLTMNGPYISPMSISVDGNTLITNSDDGNFVSSLNQTFHLAKYEKTAKLERGNHLITLTVKSPQTITASGNEANFPLELLKFGADYIAVSKSDKDILDQSETSLHMSKKMVGDENGSAFAALYLGDRLVKVQKKNAENDAEVSFDFENTSWNDYDRAKIFVWNGEQAPISDVTFHEIMPKNNKPFDGDKEINVVYLGDSLYEASGVTAGKSFVEQTGKWFKETFENEETTVNYYNEGYGSTTSGYSVVRLARDVAAHNADVVFVAQTINDGNGDSRRNLETIVKTLRSLENPPYIIFTVFPQSNGQVNATFGKEVARNYGIPVMDGTAAFEKAVAEGNTMSSLFMDGVHPNDKGHGYISEYMISQLESGRYWSKGKEPENQVVSSSKTIDIDSVEYFSVNSDRVEKSAGWSTGDGNVTSTASGDTLKFTFNGSFFGFEYGQMSTSGNIEIWVDGALVKTCNTTYSGLPNYFFVCTDKSVCLDLEKGEHTVELKTAANNSGENNRIYGIFVGDYH